MPPLSIIVPEAPATTEEWDELVADMDREDLARERTIQRHEVTETDLGVPLVALRESKRRTRTGRTPYPAGPTYYHEGRWHFPNVIGMSGTWIGPEHWWQDPETGLVYDCRGEPCAGCGGAALSRGTICARCDVSGKDAIIPEVTPQEKKADTTRYVPPKGVKGGVG